MGILGVTAMGCECPAQSLEERNQLSDAGHRVKAQQGEFGIPGNSLGVLWVPIFDLEQIHDPQDVWLAFLVVFQQLRGDRRGFCVHLWHKSPFVHLEELHPVRGEGKCSVQEFAGCQVQAQLIGLDLSPTSIP